MFFALNVVADVFVSFIEHAFGVTPVKFVVILIKNVKRLPEVAMIPMIFVRKKFLSIYIPDYRGDSFHRVYGGFRINQGVKI